ncbi:MAG: metallophosphoesterase family protein [Paracoccaceae bacterium]
MVPERILALILALLLWTGGATATPLRVIVISDLNGSYGSTSYDPRITRAIDRIIALKPDLVISTGDMVAGQRKPHLSNKVVRAMWAAFHSTVSDRLNNAGIAFAVTPGNHDASAYGGFEGERKIFRNEWKRRKPALNFIDDRDYPFFYAFDLKGVRFVSLDATTLGRLKGDQAVRLEHFADGADRVVTFSHLPLWPFAQKRVNEIIGDPELEALYQRAGILMHLSGHHHAYYPGKKDGVLYISQACLGGGARKLIGDSETSLNSFTMLEFSDDGAVKVSAFRAPGFDLEIDLNTLPKQIRSDVATLIRMDLAP